MAVPDALIPAFRHSAGRLRRAKFLSRHLSKPMAGLPAPLLLPARQAAGSCRAASRLAARQEPAPKASPAHWRTKGIAVLLALFLGGIGAHLFYLGYYGRGTAYLVATLVALGLIVVAIVGSIATLYGGGAGFVGITIAAVIINSAVSILGLVDIIRIIIGNLKPKNGEYFPGFFQTHDKS
ncbi:TM2 domain-containing protein [Hymenobacter sp. BRD128]|uniref:TM2 domain-containing protein n=1 Tax=Hymenobacter sp. BRD128 TaxID=2675878 RepID=UPI001C258E18|nr:TM2 domain-containing protein [Hymenobacter sp. BRD128]